MPKIAADQMRWSDAAGGVPRSANKFQILNLMLRQLWVYALYYMFKRPLHRFAAPAHPEDDFEPAYY